MGTKNIKVRKGRSCMSMRIRTRIEKKRTKAEGRNMVMNLD
jgi:hypothetical protein